MTEAPQQQPQHRINWFKSCANLALGVWGLITYLALLTGIAWVAAATTGPNPKAVAVFAGLSATCVNWALFSVIERHTRN